MNFSSSTDAPRLRHRRSFGQTPHNSSSASTSRATGSLRRDLSPVAQDAHFQSSIPSRLRFRRLQQTDPAPVQSSSPHQPVTNSLSVPSAAVAPSPAVHGHRSQRHINSRPSTSAFPTLQREDVGDNAQASRAHARSTIGSLQYLSLGTSLAPSEIWPTLQPSNVPTATITSAGALAIKDRVDWLTSLSPALHLVEAVHGKIPASTLKHIREWRVQRFSPSTREEYAGYVLNFLRWADDLDVPAHLRFPTHSTVLNLFFSSVAPFYAESSLNKIASGLMGWHAVHGLPWALDRTDGKTIRQAFAHLSIPPLALRRPVRIPDFVAMRKHAQVASPPAAKIDRAHVAVYACALAAFWSMARHGEFTVEKISDPEPHRPRRRDVEMLRSSPSSIPSSIIIHLPRDKTHSSGFDRVLSAQPNHLPLCPVRALLWHFHINPAPDDAGVFTYLDKNDKVRELRSGLFRKTINGWLAEEGREPVDGHSFRIGGATLLHAHGISIPDIMHLGGWASDAALLYVRDIHVKHAEITSNLQLSLPSHPSHPSSSSQSLSPAVLQS